jgi:hypothetical protein
VSSVQEDRPDRPWRGILDEAEALFIQVTGLESDHRRTLEALRGALRSRKGETAALLVLGFPDAEYLELLVDELVAVSLSHRSALRGREILGRLPHAKAEQVVPSAVWRLLRETGDYDAYRRMAELLSHLGLREALGQLCAQALRSDDLDIREVGDDFGRQDGPP